MQAAVGAGNTDYSAIAKLMSSDAPVTRQQMAYMSEYAKNGAPGMSYDEKLDLGVALSRYGYDDAGRAIMQSIHDGMASPENVIADERLVFNIPGRDPYVEDRPDTVVDMRGLAERCVKKSARYSSKSVQELDPVKSAILEYRGARSIDTNIKAAGSLRPFAEGNEVCEGYGDKRRCTPLATFHYDRIAFPTAEGVQSSKFMHIYLRHLMPTETKHCDNRGSCRVSYQYRSDSPSTWADLQCRIDKI